MNGLAVGPLNAPYSSQGGEWEIGDSDRGFGEVATLNQDIDIPRRAAVKWRRQHGQQEAGNRPSLRMSAMGWNNDE